MGDKNKFSGVKKMSICNNCKNSVGLCSWSGRLVPVDGWDAVFVEGKGDRLPSWCVRECPQFEKEPERDFKLKNTRYEYFKNLIQGGKTGD
jgi:hypothetical protein